MLPDLVSASAPISFVDGKWETTFNCAEHDTPNGSSYDCAGMIVPNGGGSEGTDQPINVTRITSAANNPLGAGNGARFWNKDGSNNCSTAYRIFFPIKLTEVWIRFYERYESGFTWSNLVYDKQLYLHTDSPEYQAVIVEPYGWNNWQAAVQGVSGSNASSQIEANGFGWQSVMGGNLADGLFHSYEVHLKMDTTGIAGTTGQPVPTADGIGQLWIDGVLRANNLAVNFSNGNVIAKTGWSYFTFDSNQSSPANSKESYVDYDDMVVYSTTPPNLDTNGNPFIGPIGFGDATAPAAPSGLSVL